MSGRILFCYGGKQTVVGIHLRFQPEWIFQIITPFVFLLFVQRSPISESFSIPPGSGRRCILALPTTTGEIAWMGKAELAPHPGAVVRGAVVPAEQQGRKSEGDARQPVRRSRSPGGQACQCRRPNVGDAAAPLRHGAATAEADHPAGARLGLRAALPAAAELHVSLC